MAHGVSIALRAFSHEHLMEGLHHPGWKQPFFRRVARRDEERAVFGGQELLLVTHSQLKCSEEMHLLLYFPASGYGKHVDTDRYDCLHIL